MASIESPVATAINSTEDLGIECCHDKCNPALARPQNRRYVFFEKRNDFSYCTKKGNLILTN